MKTKELRGLSSDELLQKEKIFKKELFDLNFQRKVGGLEKPSRFRGLRKNIARIFTILRERELDNDGNRKSKK
ncbi:LSU ribosomal protein L29p (L35e) [hydrothermal vent metagenome]|uniref:Large ribosomal subunit protein uL29 n=1 Tax=hydrothermal vent metagenome TaxID=652676 RepID=A0A3B1E426_9ZZZZ